MMEASASRNLSKLSSMTEASSFILIEGVHWKYILSGIGGVCRVWVQPEWPCRKDWVIAVSICTNKPPLLVWREGVFDNERRNGLFYDYNCSTTWLRMMWILNDVFNVNLISELLCSQILVSGNWNVYAVKHGTCIYMRKWNTKINKKGEKEYGSKRFENIPNLEKDPKRSSERALCNVLVLAPPYHWPSDMAGRSRLATFFKFDEWFPHCG